MNYGVNSDYCRNLEIKLKSPNPLFEKWLEDWHLEAASKDLQIRHVFKKALESLRKYPITLKNAKECIILENFSIELSLKLDKKLTEYMKIYPDNDLLGEPKTSDVIVNLIDKRNGVNETPQEAPVNTNQVEVPHTESSPVKRAGRGSCSYVPVKGSGSYAMLSALYNKSVVGAEASLDKMEIIEEAQRYTKVPFTLPVPGSRYTAWSSMRTLCNKHLVIKVGRPAKYYLTTSGVDLAKKLVDGRDLQNNVVNSNSTITAVNKSQPSSSVGLFGNNEKAESRSCSVNNPCSSYNPFERVKSNFNDILKIPKVHTFSSSDEEDGDMPLSKINFFKSNVKRKTPGRNLASFKRSSGKCLTPRVHTFSSSSDENDGMPLSQINILNIVKQGPKTRRKPSCTITRPPDNDKVRFTDRSSQGQSNDVLTPAFSQAGSSSSGKDNKVRFNRNQLRGKSKKTTGNLNSFGFTNEVTVGKPLSSSQTSTETNLMSSQQSVNNEIIDMHYPNFKLLLLVDSAETSGKVRSEETKNKLNQMGVECEVRRLNLGDYVWICQDVLGRELILPIIIERKRIDDFSKSIIDGRYHEQKHRIKNAQVKYRIYIIEGSKEMRTSVNMSDLMQASVNAQVISGFIVKHTHNYNDTLKYLKSLHWSFLQKLQGKTLLSYLGDVLPEFDWSTDLFELLTFKAFMKEARKKAKYTVREMFIRQLLQLHGISVEKAIAIVDKYPTPQSLIEAFKMGGTVDLISKLKTGQLERSIGPALGRNIYELYTRPKLDVPSSSRSSAEL